MSMCEEVHRSGVECFTVFEAGHSRALGIAMGGHGVGVFVGVM